MAFIDVDDSGKEKNTQVSEWSLRPYENLWCGGRGGGESCSKKRDSVRKTRMTVNYEIRMN